MGCALIKKSQKSSTRASSINSSETSQLQNINNSKRNKIIQHTRGLKLITIYEVKNELEESI